MPSLKNPKPKKEKPWQPPNRRPTLTAQERQAFERFHQANEAYRKDYRQASSSSWGDPGDNYDFFIQLLKDVGCLEVQQAQNFYDPAVEIDPKKNSEIRSDYSLWTYQDRFLIKVHSYTSRGYNTVDSQGHAHAEPPNNKVSSVDIQSRTAHTFSFALWPLVHQSVKATVNSDSGLSGESVFRVDQQHVNYGFTQAVKEMLELSRQFLLLPFDQWPSKGFFYLDPHYFESYDMVQALEDRPGEREINRLSVKTWMPELHERARQRFLKRIEKDHPSLAHMLAVNTLPNYHAVEDFPESLKSTLLEQASEVEENTNRQHAWFTRQPLNIYEAVTHWATHLGLFAFQPQTRKRWEQDIQSTYDLLFALYPETQKWSWKKEKKLKDKDDIVPDVHVQKPEQLSWPTTEVEPLYDGLTYAHLLTFYAPHLLVDWLNHLPQEDFESLMTQRDVHGFTFLMFVHHMMYESFLPFNFEPARSWSLKEEYPEGRPWIDGLLGVCEERLGIEQSVQLLNGPHESFFGTLIKEHIEEQSKVSLKKPGGMAFFEAIEARGWLRASSFDPSFRWIERLDGVRKSLFKKRGYISYTKANQQIIDDVAFHEHDLQDITTQLPESKLVERFLPWVTYHQLHQHQQPSSPLTSSLKKRL